MTCVALLAVTVRVEGLPGATEPGDAVILTVGAWLDPVVVKSLPGLVPHPITTKGSREEQRTAIHRRLRRRFRVMST
jgi:hypothetical protein